jgi:hypothetical protein
MKQAHHVLLAPFRLAEGVTEAQLLARSAAFQEHFVRAHPGILRRVLVRAEHGGYADLVFFESKEVASRVMEAEATSEHFRALLALAAPPSPTDIGLLAFEAMATYE